MSCPFASPPLCRYEYGIAARLRMLLGLLVLLASGCAVIPDVTEKPTFHNPFPQLERVAVLPFFNQSREPTIDGESIANTYAAELQKIPGFEVLPVGVVKQALATLPEEPRGGKDFQRFARMLGVDAVVIGSVTEYHPYYPPRIGMAVHWYAANPSFHPIPPGYGLPWGTPEEEYIPESLVQEAEFALAKEQLKTQTPDIVDDYGIAPASLEGEENAPRKNRRGIRRASHHDGISAGADYAEAHVEDDGLPGDWPDPRGFVPSAPSRERPSPVPQSSPVMRHVRLYDGRDSDFAERLARYFRWQDDARFGGWQGYLQRPDDFVRFCCHLHVTETLTARGGAGKSQLVSRWGIGR